MISAPSSASWRAEGLGDMLTDHDAGRVRWQQLEHLADGFSTAGGSTDGDDLIGGAKTQFRPAAVSTAGLVRRRRALKQRHHFRHRRHLDLADQLRRIGLQRVGNVDLGLGDKVDSTQFQRCQRDVGAALGQRRTHYHRHRPQPHQVAQELQSVHAWHFDVERQHVRIQ